MRILLIIVAIFIFLVSPLAGQNQATIAEYSGKVEIRPPGASWQTVENGTQITANTTLSTGFDSTATLELDQARLRVKPLTRMTLQKILRQRDTVTTEVNLQVGSLEAEVKTGEDVAHDFSVRSSVATAAVRGTSFTFEGRTLITSEGTTLLISSTGLSRSVSAGESSRTDGFGLPVDPKDAKERDFSVEGYVAGTDEDTFLHIKPQSANIPPVEEEPPQATTITIEWE
jgi:hypothetical protein